MAFFSVAVLRKLVAHKSGLSEGEVERVLAAQGAIMRGLLETGAKVRFLDGWMITQKMKATRRRHPKSGEMVDVPPREKVAYKEPPLR
ncbi:MAG: hypothetical protein JWO88_3611 [Frankiales bacterium]|nr:hypothetical protein [Frankiales bacterium]